MGTIYKRGSMWGINYINPAGKRVRRLVSRYSDAAKKVLKKVEIQIAEGKYLDARKNENIFFDDFAQKYFDTYVSLENRGVKNQGYLLNGLVKYFHGKYLHQITSFDIRQYMAKRIKKVKPSSVNKDLTMLKSMFNRAIEWEIFFGDNPAKGIRKLAENNERCRWLDEEEQECVLSHCKGITKIIVLVALKTGLRWGEIINLKWSQAPKSNYIDITNKVIFIHESLTKSKKSRYVPLAETVLKVLKEVPH